MYYVNVYFNVVEMDFSSCLCSLLLLFRLAMMSKLELKEDKIMEVQFVGDDDVLNHILDREGGIYYTVIKLKRCLCDGYGLSHFLKYFNLLKKYSTKYLI